ncbi:MAG: hypothetical protein JSV00_05085 [bacterium]|nr:MAG: hypothetical protein JSV00_05085 [bacterium]
MRWWMKPAAAGCLLAGLVAAAALALRPWAGQSLPAIPLAVLPGIYAGIAWRVRDRALLAVETGATLFFLFLFLAGMAASPVIHLVGYLVQGVWSLAHHPRYIRSPGPWWWTPLCAACDWTLALFLLGLLPGRVPGS